MPSRLEIVHGNAHSLTNEVQYHCCYVYLILCLEIIYSPIIPASPVPNNLHREGSHTSASMALKRGQVSLDW